MQNDDFQALVSQLELARTSGDLEGVGEIHPADIAQAMQDVPPTAQALIFSLLSDAKAAEVLADLEPVVVQTLVASLAPARLTRLLDHMDPDDAADVVQELPDALRDRALAGVEAETRRDLTLLGTYEPESAGGVMTTEVVSVPSNGTAASAQEVLKDAEQPEAMADLFVVDPAGTLVGRLDIKSLLNAEGPEPVSGLMDREVVSIVADADREEAARLMDRYHLTTLPVVDAAERLKGVITADDIIEVLAEEASEDILRLAGTGVVHPTAERLVTRLRARAPWLSVTLAGTFLAGLLIEWIETHWFTIEGPLDGTFKALLYFIPLVGGMAGNVGSQSSTVMVRGFATGEVDPERPGRVLPGELILALAIGLASGLLVGVATALAHGDRAWLGLIVGSALPCAILVAALAGTLVPFACHRIKVDPAYAAGPFLLTLNDIAAYLIYFAVAIGIMDLLGVS